MSYVVTDSLGNIMGIFSTYEQASTYKFARGNSNWKIKPLKVKNKWKQRIY